MPSAVAMNLLQNSLNTCSHTPLPNSKYAGVSKHRPHLKLIQWYRFRQYSQGVYYNRLHLASVHVMNMVSTKGEPATMYLAVRYSCSVETCSLYSQLGSQTMTADSSGTPSVHYHHGNSPTLLHRCSEGAAMSEGGGLWRSWSYMHVHLLPGFHPAFFACRVRALERG